MSERLPLYKQLGESLVERIRSGELKPGDRVPSENDLVKQRGVSRITARQALAELAHEGWVVRERGRGTFVAESRFAQGRTKSGSIGVVIPRLKDAYATRIVFGVEEALADAGYHLVFRSATNQEEEIESIRDLVRANVEGVIVWPVSNEYVNDELVRLHLAHFPIVLVDRFLRGVSMDCVQSDNLRGGYMATHHLVQLGHRHIAYVAGDFRHVTSVEERYLGFRTALREAKASEADGPLWLIPARGDWCTWLAAQIEERPDVTAVFCENDDVAMQILRCLQSMGIPVPERMSIVGFDDKDSVKDVAVPLTTIRQDAPNLGRTAGRLLLARIEGRYEAIQHFHLPVELIVRKSTAGPGLAEQAL